MKPVLRPALFGLDLALRRFTLNPQSGALVPVAVPEPIPQDPRAPSPSFAIAASTQVLPALSIHPVNNDFETIATDLLIYHTNASTGMFGMPNIIGLGTYNRDAKGGTSVIGLMVSTDAHNVFFSSEQSLTLVENGVLVFQNSCSFGRASIDLATGLPTLEPSADFGSECETGSGLLTQAGTYFYRKSGTKIVGAAIASDGTLKVIGSTSEPLLQSAEDIPGDFITSAKPR